MKTLVSKGELETMTPSPFEFTGPIRDGIGISIDPVSGSGILLGYNAIPLRCKRDFPGLIG